MAQRSLVATSAPERSAELAPRVPERVTARGRLVPRGALPDLLGLLLVAAAAVAVLAPALFHGGSLGPFDLLSRYGVTRRSGVTVHNAQTTDQIAQLIPWTTLAWTQVHHGQLPLWNPYSALGMPLAFNWQSATFSVPALLGYLAPVRFAYSVQVVVTLVLAGAGTYVFGRVLRLGVAASVMAGVVFELSGAFMGFLGWPIAGVLAWAGWLFAAGLLIVRGRRRARAVVLFAVAVAGGVYAGQPDALVLLAPGLLVFLVVLLAIRARQASGAILRPLADLAVASVAGGALAAPLIAPGFPLITGSVFFHSERANGALPLHDLVNLVFQGYVALPVTQSHWFGVGSTTYVGVIALVLAGTAAALRRHQPEVVALVAVGLVMAALVFVPELATVMNSLPFRARWHLGLVVVVFVVAVLAGFGTDAIVRTPNDPRIRLWCGSGFGVASLVLLVLWFLGRGHLSPEATRIREQSFIWPTVGSVLGLVVVASLSTVARSGDMASGPRRWRLGAGRWAGSALLIGETAFLIAVGAPLWSSSPTFLAPTPAEEALHSAVGSSIVGFGVHSCELPPTLGIIPETTDAFGVHELAAYDPITPRAYFRLLKVAPRIPLSAFCPVVKTAAQARRYGVQFVLEPHGARGPRGAVFDQAIGDEDLYRVPFAAAATLSPMPASGKLPAPGAPGLPVGVTHPDPAAWHIVTQASTPQVLRIRLTDVPGWHATIDGRSLGLERFSGIMLQARIPAGHHSVELRYWPGAFTAGIALAACSAVGLAAGALLGWRRRRVVIGNGHVHRVDR